MGIGDGLVRHVGRPRAPRRPRRRRGQGAGRPHSLTGPRSPRPPGPVAAALVVLALAALSACSDDDQSGGPEPTVVTPTTTTTAAPSRRSPPPDVTLTVTGADVVGPAGSTRPLVDPTLSELVGGGRPLPRRDVAPPADRPTRARAWPRCSPTTPPSRRPPTDRAVVFDEGVPVAPGVEAVEATVDLHALAGPADDFGVVVVGLVWDVRGAVGRAPRPVS